MNSIKHINLEEHHDSSLISLYVKHEKIQTRWIDGFYQRIRRYTGIPLLILFFGTAWLNIHGRQAVLFDLPARKFHIFWLTFWPQDFGLLAWALMIAAFSLFFVTSLLGRVWCGYTCPQTVWTRIFMWVERITEGDRLHRIHLDQAPLSFDKVWRRGAKHTLWIVIALASGGTFVGYFYGVRDLVWDAAHFDMPWVAVFWTVFLSAATYVNAGWMREQVCIYMCPYARFQSAMFDKDTMIVSYDAERGEPRGSRKKGADQAAAGLGDCIDCTYCVQVCPTGIDIRNGLQYECINCALCVDACDAVMDKMGYEHGLISYTTENKLAGRGWTWRRIKPVGYGIAIFAMITLFSTRLILREPLEVDVIRNRGHLYQEVPGGRIQNTFTIKILNMDDRDHRYRVSVTGLPSPTLVPDDPVSVPAESVGEISVNVLVDPDQLHAVYRNIEFHVKAETAGWQATSDSRFFGPRVEAE